MRLNCVDLGEAGHIPSTENPKEVEIAGEEVKVAFWAVAEGSAPLAREVLEELVPAIVWEEAQEASNINGTM